MLWNGNLSVNKHSDVQIYNPMRIRRRESACVTGASVSMTPGFQSAFQFRIRWLLQEFAVNSNSKS